MRYHVTVDLPYDGKPNLRAALRHIGATAVRIEQAKEAAAVKPIVRDDCPTTDAAKAVADLFGRKHSQPWTEDEIKAFKAALKRGVMTLDNVRLVATYYRSERKKEDNFCRVTVLTLLRHFDAELDKARTARPSSRRGEWVPHVVGAVVTPELPPLSAAEQDAVTRFQAELDERKRRAL